MTVRSSAAAVVQQTLERTGKDVGYYRMARRAEVIVVRDEQTIGRHRCPCQRIERVDAHDTARDTELQEHAA